MPAPKTDESGIRQTIRALKKAGYTLAYVYDGEDDVSVSTEQEAIEAIMAVDDAHLHVDSAEHVAGWVRFVMGNEPFEVICNHTVDLEPVLDPLMRGWGAY